MLTFYFSASLSTRWTRITTGSVTSLDYYGGYLYGVGLNRAVYRTKPNGRWTCITTGSVTMIKVYNGIIYGLGMDKAIWKWLGRRWTRITSGSVTYFTISRNNIYGVGTNKRQRSVIPVLIYVTLVGRLYILKYVDSN